VEVADAVTRGIIIEPSGSEWPQGSRAPRHPSFAGPPIDEGALLAAAQSLTIVRILMTDPLVVSQFEF
jgi:hypothetical protein